MLPGLDIWEPAAIVEGLACHVQDPNAAKGLFGFHVDNTIGGNAQPNGWMDNWVDFFRERRLGYQLSLCTDSKLKQMGKKLMANLERFFEDVEVNAPSSFIQLLLR